MSQTEKTYTAKLSQIATKERTLVGILLNSNKHVPIQAKSYYSFCSSLSHQIDQNVDQNFLLHL